MNYRTNSVRRTGSIAVRGSRVDRKDLRSGSATMSMTIRRLLPDDLGLMHALLDLFGEVFDEKPTYGSARPSAGYQRRLLGDPGFVALTMLRDSEVVGGLVAYELRKFEQERSEFYIYDLAVGAAHRRMGIATALIEHLKGIAVARGAYVIFVQADQGDAAAIALYSKFGMREDVLHFDIAVVPGLVPEPS
jgi:aminoglycoside 3-N-acetyltransferase I